MSVTFPNVPQLPGVPQLARAALFVAIALPVLGRSAATPPLWRSSQTGPTWGILDQKGNVVLVPDSFLAFARRKESRIPDFPLQKGSFAAYNKVQLPFEIPLRLSKGGSLVEREQFIDTLERIEGDTNLYNILTPEKTYLNVNITRTEVTRRGPNGAYYLGEVDIFFREIRQVQAQYSSTSADTSNAADPDAIPSTSLGQQQPQVPAPAVKQQFISESVTWTG